MEFIATIEDSFFEYEVKAYITNECVDILDIYFFGDPLNLKQFTMFIVKYGIDDLLNEIKAQFRRHCEEQKTEELIERFIDSKP